MNMQVVVRNAEDSAEVREFAEDAVARAIERFEDRIVSAIIRLEDETGPVKGGVDKVCSIDLKLTHGEIHIRERTDAFRDSINTAADRLKAALSREIAKAKRGVGEG